MDPKASCEVCEVGVAAGRAARRSDGSKGTTRGGGGGSCSTVSRGGCSG
jgi:hypothetical protein